MYREALKRDLKAIFKLKRVDVERSLETCIEQDVLCVDVESVKTGAEDGQATARVSGTIGVRSTDKHRMSGFLIKKINEAPAELLARFWFSQKEEHTAFSPADFELKGYRLSFTYFYKEEYNPAKGPLALANWIWGKK